MHYRTVPLYQLKKNCPLTLFTRMVLSVLTLFIIGMLGISGCATQKLLTGEPLIYGIDTESGAIVDRDVETGGVFIHKGEIITLMVNTVFIKLLKDFGNPHVLVYAEVYDAGTDNPETALRKILFNGENTPQGVNLGLSDRILYGPAPFKGFPIRIKFFIVEIDKAEKEIASKMINAAGSMAQAAQPQFATAMGVAVQLAQALNALNEDDFELRFDLTLYPIALTDKTWNVKDKTLESLNEPVQRQGKMFHLATPLRTGPYIILKRELSERMTPEDKCSEEAIIVMDHAQEGFIHEYQKFKNPNENIQTIEILRYSGGYIYWVIRNILTLLPEGGKALVRTCENPQVPTLLVPGIRSLYHGRTYAIITLVTGLPEGLDEQAMRASSDRDLAQLKNLLDNPDQVPIDKHVGPYIDQLSDSVISAIEHRRLAIRAARRENLDPTFRKSPSYPEYWIQNLEDIGNLSEDDKRHRQAKNTAILSMLTEIIVNLPPFKADDIKSIKCLMTLEADDIVSIEKKSGLFSLKEEEGLKKFKECQQRKTE